MVSAEPRERAAAADVCLVLEGTYPYVRGGVSTWVHDLIGSLPDLRFALLIGVVYAASMFAINAMFDLNYGYLGRATPTVPTLLDVLGPYPLRCVFMVLLGAAAMTALWLPWLLVRTPQRARVA